MHMPPIQGKAILHVFIHIVSAKQHCKVYGMVNTLYNMYDKAAQCIYKLLPNYDQ